eukprot:113997_1
MIKTLRVFATYKRMNRYAMTVFQYRQFCIASPTTDPGHPHCNPLVVCGPSGVGKGTLLQYLLSNRSSHFGMSLSHTTRSPRIGEINDKHYKFIDRDLFKKGIDEGEYIEYALTHGNYYGTNIDQITNLEREGKICILEIDVKGAKQIKETHSHLNCNFLFITCPSPLDTLEKRLTMRGTENEEQIKTRLDTAKIELDFLHEYPHFFDHLLMNDDMKIAIDKLKCILNEWYPWLNLH